MIGNEDPEATDVLWINLKAEMEQEKDETSSDDKSSEWENNQNTVQIVVISEISTDEGTLHSYCTSTASSVLLQTYK